MKKLLALVLALVMTLGLATVGANAADFKDESSIEYAEAVNVMSGIGVIQGDDNGNFNPKGTLTREQAAKIVAYMMLGKSGADSLSATVAPFSDVAADRWSAGAISYCATEGIIAGLGDGTFNPTGKLTGHQFAKMLLVALGYDPAFEGLVGADWAVNTAKLAVSADLEEDLTVVLSQEITRDQAAMMAFNTLKADLVEYNGATNVKTNDGTEVTVNAKREKSDKRTNLYDNRGNDNEDKFCEVYFKDLKLIDNGTNDFGEPVNKWTYKNVTISEEAKIAEQVLVGGVTYEDLYAAIGSAATNRVDNLDIYVDGAKIYTLNSLGGAKLDNQNVRLEDNTAKKWVKDLDEDLSWRNSAGTATASSLALPTGNGTVTSVFVDHDTTNNDYDITISVKHIYAGKVTSVTEASGSSARKVTISAKTNPGETLTGRTLDNEFETTEFKKNDIVLFTVADGTAAAEAKIQSMELATLVSGAEVTKTSVEGTKPNKSVVTAGGKDYKLNINVKVDGTIAWAAINKFEVGDKFDLYLDNNGLVVFAEKTEEELNLANYLVLVDGTMSTNSTTPRPLASGYTLDGVKLTDIKITKYDGNSLTNWNNIDLFKVYKYTKTSAGDYELKPVDGSYSAIDLRTADYASGAASLLGSTANASTKLYVYDFNGDKWSTYTGVKNFPGVDTTQGAAVTVDVNGTGSKTYGNNVYEAALVKDSVVVAAVFAHNHGGTYAVESKVSANDVIYVTSKNYTTSKDGDDTVYTFEVIKDGKLTTVSTKETGVRNLLANDQDLYIIDKYDGDYVDTVYDRAGVKDAEDRLGVNRTGTLAALLPVDGVVSTKTAWGRSVIGAGLDIDTNNGAGQAVYTVDVDVTSGTFKLVLKDTNGDDVSVDPFVTNSSTKFFEITKNGGVTEKDAADFNYDALTEGEFSVIYDVDDSVATYIFYQKV